MVIMEMVKEFTSAEALTAQPYNVVRWLDQDVVGEAFDDGEELLKNVLRFIQDFAHRAPAIGLIDPGIDVILSFQVRRPVWGRFRFAALCGLQVGDNSALPASQVRDDIFDGTVAVHAGLIHARRANLIEKRFPLLILFLQPIQKFRFCFGQTHAVHPVPDARRPKGLGWRYEAHLRGLDMDNVNLTNTVPRKELC